MKQLILLIFFFLMFITVGQAQEIRINGYTSYVFDDKFDAYNSSTSYLNGKILGGFQWGAGLEYLATPYYGTEILYFRQDTEVPIRYYRQGEISRQLDISVNYIMLGGVRYADAGRVQGYGGLMLGAVIYDNKAPIEREPNSVTKFAWGLRLGGNLWATDKIGLKVQTHLLSGVQAFGGGFYFGSGGSGAGLSTYSTLFQFSLGGGLTIRMGG